MKFNGQGFWTRRNLMARVFGHTARVFGLVKFCGWIFEILFRTRTFRAGGVLLRWSVSFDFKVLESFSALTWILRLQDFNFVYRSPVQFQSSFDFITKIPMFSLRFLIILYRFGSFRIQCSNIPGCNKINNNEWN
ncbi:hypothetical protein RCL_jg23532.t2 [Rhizophagus clarus]|uniref:Uncharacterized protein n=1 Tax=Rhizophagus clarus TaxID=94130 RepID=A0A8H3QDL1_9GLOM|nr:hypothetical protein RCL_jg23532.t2 [Rhizophagus clarus]